MQKKPIRKPPSPRRQRRKDARPAELIAAALALFVERGYAATRLEDVAQRAGVAKGTVYLYFKDKRALFDGVMREAILPELEQAELRFDQYPGTTAVLLRDTLDEWLRLLADGRFSRLPRLMVTESGTFPELSQVFHDSVIARARTLLTRVVERGIARGEFRAVDVESTVEVLLSAIWMPSIARHSDGFYAQQPPALPRYTAALVSLVVDGLSTTSAAVVKKRQPGRGA